MTTSTLNETFFVIKEKNEVNKNLCFNTELLDRCRTISPRIEKYLKNYGTLVEPELQLIEVDSIHGLEPIINKRTGQTTPWISSSFRRRYSFNRCRGSRLFYECQRVGPLS